MKYLLWCLLGCLPLSAYAQESSVPPPVVRRLSAYTLQLGGSFYTNRAQERMVLPGADVGSTAGGLTLGLLYTRQAGENRAWETGLLLQRRVIDLALLPSTTSSREEATVGVTVIHLPLRYLIRGGPSGYGVRSGKNGGVYGGVALRYLLYDREGSERINAVVNNQLTRRFVPGLTLGGRTAGSGLNLGAEVELGLVSLARVAGFRELTFSATLGYVFSY